MSPQPRNTRDPHYAITRGTGNIFADLGYANADERQARLCLAHAIQEVAAQCGLTEAAVAEKLGVTQPEVSTLADYKRDGFSVERLMVFLMALNQETGRDSGGHLPTAPACPSYRLDDLMAQLRPEHRHDEADFGAAVGREDW